MRIWLRRVLMGVGRALGLLLIGSGGFSAWAITTFDGRQQFPNVERPGIQASTDPAIIAAGHYIVHGPAHCSQCTARRIASIPRRSRTRR
jgi:hypothetical protein